MSITPDRIVGLVMWIVSVCISYSAILLVRSWLKLNVAVALFSLVLLSPVALACGVIGWKLVLQRSETPVTMDEVKERIEKVGIERRMPALSMVIYLFGIDGSGKTTQLKLIAQALRNRGMKYKYVWLRWVAFVSYPFLAMCRLLGYTQWKVNENGIRYAERRFYRNRVLAQIWTWLFVIDMLAYSTILVRIPIMLNSVILCDRFVLDAIVDLINETRRHDLLKGIVGRLFRSLLPKSSLILLLDADEEEAFSRKADTPSLNYLRQLRQSYLELAHSLSIPILNGNESPENVYKEIVDKFLAHYPMYHVIQS